ncbi:MAG: GGDEF domain-containing protein [Eubacteriales bacterium]
MVDFSYFEVNLISAAVCIVILCNLRERSFRNAMIDSSLFRLLLIINTLLLLTDNCITLLNGRTFGGAYTLNVISTSIYYILQPAFALIWMLYSNYKLFADRERLMRKLPLYIVPFVVNVLLAVISPYTHTIFFIDSMNNYQRGDLFSLSYAVAFIYYFLVWGFIFMRLHESRSPYDVKNCRYFALFPLPALISSILQWIFSGISLIWVTNTLLLLVIFINIQNNQISTDPLTGLYNRRYLDRCIHDMIHDRTDGELLFAALIDIDSFKSINDLYGHATGDRALVRTAEILRRNCGHGDILARFGGDEFVVVGKRPNHRTLGKTLSLIRGGVDSFNSAAHEKFVLSFSIGTAVFGINAIDTPEKLISAADAAMYREKQRKNGAQKA